MCKSHNDVLQLCRNLKFYTERNALRVPVGLRYFDQLSHVQVSGIVALFSCLEVYSAWDFILLAQPSHLFREKRHSIQVFDYEDGSYDIIYAREPVRRSNPSSFRLLRPPLILQNVSTKRLKIERFKALPNQFRGITRGE